MLFDRRPPIPMTTVMGRVLSCSRCSKLVDLVEIPRPDVDPDTYVCLDHFQPVANGSRRENEVAPPRRSTEPPAPSRDLASQIRDYHAATFGSAA